MNIHVFERLTVCFLHLKRPISIWTCITLACFQVIWKTRLREEDAFSSLRLAKMCWFSPDETEGVFLLSGLPKLEVSLLSDLLGTDISFHSFSGIQTSMERIQRKGWKHLQIITVVSACIENVICLLANLSS